MNGSAQLALVLTGQAKHPIRSIRRAILRFERWDRDGYLYSPRQYTRRDVELLLPADLQAELAALTLASEKLRPISGGDTTSIVTVRPGQPTIRTLTPMTGQAYIDQHRAFQRKHRCAYEKALGLWRAAQYAEWAITFDFAEQLGFRLTVKQKQLRARVNAAMGVGQ